MILPVIQPKGCLKFVLITFLIITATLPCSIELSNLTMMIRQVHKMISDTKRRIMPASTSDKPVFANKKSFILPKFNRFPERSNNQSNQSINQSLYQSSIISFNFSNTAASCDCELRADFTMLI